MWRKPTDVKPPSKSSEVPIPPAPARPQPAPPVVPEPASAPSAPPVSAVPVARAIIASDNSGVSTIGTGLKIRGELSGNSDLYIDGEAQGKIILSGSRVTVGPNGRVQADIEAREIIVQGAVQGNLKARESLRLGSSSQVQGSVQTPRIGIDDGAKLRGKVEMTRTVESHALSAAVQTTEVAASASVHSESE